MKECSRCGQEMPDWAIACDCGQRLSSIDNPAAQAGATAPGSAQPSPPSGRSLGRREILTIAVAVLGGGTVTLAMLLSSGSAAVNSSATPPASTAAVARSASAAGASSSPLPAAPKWEDTTTDWVANVKKGVAFEVKSENRVQIWQRTAHPALVVRCYAKQVDVFVYTESAAKIEREDENHTVRLAFDDQPERTERWPDSDEHDALFAPDGKAFVQRLATARLFRFGYTPHNASPVVATFHVAGLAGLMEPAGKHCGE